MVQLMFFDLYCLEIVTLLLFFVDNDKEVVVQQLVQILTSEGDAINEKVVIPKFASLTGI